jgi:hypothetical protein
MALRNIFNNNKIDLSTAEIDSFTMKNGATSITHSIDSTGHYSISSDTSTLLKFDSSSLVDGPILQAIITNTDEITLLANNIGSVSTTVSTLSSTVSSLSETVSGLAGGSSGLQNLSSVLTAGNDAAGKSITGLHELHANELFISGVSLSTNSDSLVCDGLQTGELQATTIYLNNVSLEARISNIESYITNLREFFNTLNSAAIIHKSDGTIFNFSSLI